MRERGAPSGNRIAEGAPRFELRAVGERRGSMVMCAAPRLRPSSNHCIAGDIVSAGLAPTSRMT